MSNTSARLPEWVRSIRENEEGEGAEEEEAISKDNINPQHNQSLQKAPQRRRMWMM